MQQPKSKYLHEGSDFYVKLSYGGGHVFLHCEVLNWTPSVYRKLKKLFRQALEIAYSENYELLFVTSENQMSVKFWKMFGELEELDKFGPRNEYYIGCWHIEDTLNGN